MKYVIIIGDGMADHPQEALGGKTPLEYAYNPHMHLLAQRGKTGIMQTSYPGLPVGSTVANMGILGYDPYKYYPVGRASFESLAHGVSIQEGDICFRCNLITVDEDERITDFTSSFISDGDALNIINNMEFSNAIGKIHLFHSQSYRNILILKNAGISAEEFVCYEPHVYKGRNIREILVEGKTPKAREYADFLNGLLLESLERCKELNKSFNTRASMLWLWSPSDKPHLYSFYERYGKKGAVVAALNFMKGIALAGKMFTQDIPEATGYLDTNYNNKVKYALKFLEDRDFVYIHVNAPDEESHSGNIRGKVKAIEDLDSEIVYPIIKYLNQKYHNNYRVAIMPDHYTLLANGQHNDKKVPFLVYGKGIEPDSSMLYSEKESQEKGQWDIKSTQFMDIFFNNHA